MNNRAWRDCRAGITEAIEAYPQVGPVWLPTYTPWLNPIEKLWRWGRQDILKLHRVACDPKGLRQRADSFLNNLPKDRMRCCAMRACSAMDNAPRQSPGVDCRTCLSKLIRAAEAGFSRSGCSFYFPVSLMGVSISAPSLIMQFYLEKTVMKRPFEKLSDAELLQRYAEGDEAAFREIVSRYKNSLYAFLKQFLNQPDLVDDVFQETFLQLFTSRESFDPSRPLRPWLFTIAANKAKDALRKAQRTSAVPIGTIAEPDDMSFDEMLNTLGSDTAVPYDEVERSETAARVGEVIGNMPENLREILILAYFNRFSYKQMAEILSIPIGTVKSRLHTAVARFAKDWKAAVGSKEVK